MIYFVKGKDEKFRQMWKMTKISEFHEGRDKRIQGVTLKTPTGVIKRTVQMIYLMELKD